MSERSPKVRKKSEVSSRKSEEVKAESAKPKATKPETDTSAPDSYRDNTPQSALEKELQTENRPLQTEPMEVHHHPQLEHKPKPWKEYLLEGLMIFLAVTMGFFAESLREHITDSSREKEFAKALYAELRDDSVAAATKLQYRLQKEKSMDYLYAYFKDSSLTVLPRKFYPAFTTSLYMINIYAFEPKDGILSQLRNSGSLRYFKSVPLQKLLGDLSVAINNMRYRNEQDYQYFANPIKPFLLKHFDFHWLNQIRTEKSDPNMIKIMEQYMSGSSTIKGEVLNAAQLDRKEAANMVDFYKALIISSNSLQLNAYITTNKQILKVLRDNYPLADE
ncbi:MAG TPA: hypothetical protein VK668_01330 [Mucilaginibacter sp.]|nr:hypothetical protein [Mucilaginibacter sp.]